MKTIMYHYIRNNNKEYPYFNNLSKKLFKKQLTKLDKKYGIIEDIKEISKKNKKVLLTFDDGFKDHFFAAKELKKINKIGIFFLPTLPFQSQKILNVHKIHFLLGKIKPHLALNALKEYLSSKKVNLDYNKLNKKFRKIYSHFNDYSDKSEFKKIINYFIKDYNLQTKILDHLIRKFKIKISCKKIYLSNKEINIMKNMGMIIASHSHRHRLLSNLNYKDQKREIIRSIDFLEKKFKINIDHFCYPYGGKISYNTNTIKILKKTNITKAFSVGNKDTNLLKLKKHDYEIPRYDCNKFI